MDLFTQFLPKLITLVGIGLVIFEAAFRKDGPDPALIALYATILGSPFAYKADEIRKERKNGNGLGQSKEAEV